MKKYTCSLVLAAIIGTPISTFAQQVDADNLEEAATLGTLLLSATEGLRQQCVKLLPEKSKDIETLSLYWQDKNKIETRALTLYRESASKAWVNMISSLLVEQDKRQERLTADKRIQQCNTYFGNITSGKVNMSARIPKASALLSTYADEHPQSEDEYQRSEFRWGCMKQQANRALTNGLSFSIEKAQELCSCLVEIRQANTTPEQRRAENDYAGSNGTLPMPPHIKELLPLYQKCNQTQ